jgi:hypothetical protein
MEKRIVVTGRMTWHGGGGEYQKKKNNIRLTKADLTWKGRQAASAFGRRCGRYFAQVYERVHAWPSTKKNAIKTQQKKKYNKNIIKIQWQQ